METITINRKDLKKLVKEDLMELLSDKNTRKYLMEALEDIGLSRAIDEGMKTGPIDKNKFIKNLENRAKG